MSRIRPRAAIVTALSAAALAAGLAVPAGAGATTAPAPRTAPVAVLPLLGEAHGAPVAGVRAATAPPTPITSPLSPSQCEARWGIECYDASLLRKIYGLGSRDEGEGAVVALIMPYHNPVLRHDLDIYAKQAGLPVPDLHVYEVGHPVTASPGNTTQAAAEMEAELDVEMIYAMAPRARIDFYETEEDFSLSPLDFSYYANILKGLAAQRPRVDAVSLSLGWAEGNYAEAAGSVPAGNAVIRGQAATINTAIRAGITFTVATGDTGSAGVNLAGNALYPGPAVLFPASDPLVVGASGTEVHADDSGTRTAPDTVWANGGDNGATGGGLSQVFAQPSYQRPYVALTGNHRGVGDISVDAATESPVWMYTSEYNLFAPEEATGWEFIAGTSASAPLFTGIVADTAAIAGHPLGDIHPALYAMARHPAASGIQPVTSGCNTDYGVPGYCATTAPWSLPDGVGTVGNGARFVRALAAAASRR